MLQVDANPTEESHVGAEQPSARLDWESWLESATSAAKGAASTSDPQTPAGRAAATPVAAGPATRPATRPTIVELPSEELPGLVTELPPEPASSNPQSEPNDR
ncbi:MAG: hypothetical protein NZ561_03840, partial [Phycisphaerae bacterium]|nr:hypothetical protein [Phycisphaerae bacterium]